MDVQQIIALALGAVALFFAGRHVWAELRGFIRPSEAGGCPGCGGCDAALASEAADREQTGRPETPLVSVGTNLPPHLERLRRKPRD